MIVRCVVMVSLALVAWLGTARAASPLAVGTVRSEPDVASEAGAVSLLVHTALGDARPLVAVPPDVTLTTAKTAVVTLDASHLVLLELARDGTGLRATVAITDKAGKLEIVHVRAGDGDVQGVAKGITDKIAAVANISSVRVPAVSLGRLRPYVDAIRLAGAAPDEAALALGDAVPTSALAGPALRSALETLPTKVTDPAHAVLVAYAIRDVRRLELLGAGTGDVALAARSLALLTGTTNLKGAEDALGARPPRHGLVDLAQVAIAIARADVKLLRDRLTRGLASDQARPILALASSTEPALLAAPTHRMLMGAVEKLKPSIGVASRIGLGAALANVEVPRALALIDARELDDYELSKLEGLVAKGTDATSARLRAEIALRRGDGTEPIAIEQLVQIAPTEPRTRRYRGWLLAEQNKHAEAATELLAAGATHEHVRALAAANDLTAAAAAIKGAPRTPGEQAIAARIAIRDKNIDVAMSTIALAERAAPLSSTVHLAIVELDQAKPDAARRALALQVIGDDSGTIALAGSGSSAPTLAVGSGSATAMPTISAAEAAIDATPLEPLLAALTALQGLRGHKVTLAQVAWDGPVHSFKRIDGMPVRLGLRKLLAAQPYRMQVVDVFQQLPDAPVAREALDKLTTDADATLIYRIEPRGDKPHISLLLYERGDEEVSTIAQAIRMPNVVVTDTGKLGLVIAVGSILVLSVLVWLLRPKGVIKINIKRAPDVDQEVLCVEASKSSRRPTVEDPAAFHAATRKAGAIAKPKLATLIASGHKLKLPTGRWHVHLYGAYVRGAGIRAVPATCSQEVQLRRGQLEEVTFDLTSKLAEVTVELVAKNPRGIAVWTKEALHDKVFTDANGIAMLQLAVGSHTLMIDAHGTKHEQVVQIVSPKLHKISINIEREQMLSSGIALDLPSAPASTPASAPANKPAPASTVALPPAAAAAEPVVKMKVRLPSPALDATQALSADSAPVLPPEPAISLRKHARAATPVPGEKLLGRYRVIAELGRGAMGVVHRAWDENLEREVAIKEMAEALRSNPEALRLFTQEAKALAQLNHSNIVAMYDQIVDDRGVYMIMELVDGKPLASIIEARGSLPWLEAVGIVDQLCAGLAYAHARKVIHRDIKPANIFVGTDKTVKLGDFGLARVMREVTIRQTEIRGTPLYMAPEQITGTNVDHRTDLYAIGCTLFELVTGRPPFIDGDILYAQMHQPPPLASSLASDIPKGLDDLITSLLAKQADDRPGSANEVRTAMRQLFAP